MEYSQKYCLVHFISSIATSTQFNMSDWPLHITLADVFAIDRQNSNVDKELDLLCGKRTSVNTNVTSESTLGNTAVVLLDKNFELLELHNDIVSLLEEKGAIFNNPEFTKDGFVAHCTIQPKERLTIGDQVMIDSVSLVDMYPDGDWQERKVLSTFKLK
jgi:hypothetical protein